MSRRILCPRCQNETVYGPENPYRPFCSERCKTIDLGAWATESYRVPVPPSGSPDEQMLMDSEFAEELEDVFEESSSKEKI